VSGRAGRDGVARLSYQLVHLFRSQDQCLLYDGATGALVRLGEGPFRQWKQFLAPRNQGTDTGGQGRGGSGELQDPPGLAQLHQLGLFRAPQYPTASDSPLGAAGLHSLCLNVAHACDLACAYCFAGAGEYGREGEPGNASPTPAIMPLETAQAALDFLLGNSPPGRTVSVDFFGGEPLLAWDTVVGTVDYGRERAAALGKQILFTLTTNGCALDDHRAHFCAANISTVIVSIDGRPETHDRLRRDRSGGPSYARALRGARLLQEALRQTGAHAAAATDKYSSSLPGAVASVSQAALRPDRPLESGPLWIRGTYTAHNLDFWRDVQHLRELGMDQISMEPVTTGPDDKALYRLLPSHLPAIRDSYARIAEMVTEGRLRFFHYELNTKQPACAPKRYSGCAAGAGYGCVDPQGRLFPCHQFDGQPGWCQGGVAELEGYVLLPALAGATVGAKQTCRDCWAQLLCGGGCHYSAWRHSGHGGLLEPDPLACLIGKARLEAALGVQARVTGSAVAADQT